MKNNQKAPVGITEIEESLQVVKNVYNQKAKTYDFLYSGKVIDCENNMLQDVLSRSIPKNESVLDAGCGTGLVLDLVHINPLLYTGMDFAQGAVDEAKKKYPEHNFICNDARVLNNTYDNIVSTFAMPDYIGLDWLNIAAKHATKKIICTFCNQRKHITAFDKEPIVFRPSADEIHARCKELNFQMWSMLGLGYDYLTDDDDIDFINSEIEESLFDLDNCKYIILMVNV